MAANKRKDEECGATQRTPQESLSAKQSPLSDETAEQVKKEILLGVDIGYKRPPERSRFRKGQSGNPRGRPRKDAVPPIGSNSVYDLTLKESRRLLTVREGEETREMTTSEAIMRSQVKSAVGGGQYAQKHFIERLVRAETADRRRLDEEVEVAKQYVARCREEIVEAASKGETPPRHLPHPDDVIIDSEKGVRIVGPVNEQEAAELDRTRKLRDLLLMQDALERRLNDNPESDAPCDRITTALLFATVLDNSMPARFRLSDIEMELKTRRGEVMPKRELLKTLYRAWREIGVPLPRGWTFPPLPWGTEFLQLMIEMSREASPNDDRLLNYTERLRELFREGFGRKSPK